MSRFVIPKQGGTETGVLVTVFAIAVIQVLVYVGIVAAVVTVAFHFIHKLW
jgi:hypothetical protein